MIRLIIMIGASLILAALVAHQYGYPALFRSEEDRYNREAMARAVRAHPEVLDKVSGQERELLLKISEERFFGDYKKAGTFLEKLLEGVSSEDISKKIK